MSDCNCGDDDAGFAVALPSCTMLYRATSRDVTQGMEGN